MNRTRRINLGSGLLLGACAAVIGGAVIPAADGATDDDTDQRRAVRLADPREHLVGRMIPDLEFTDLAGAPGRLSDFADAKALVIVVRDESCPISKKYGPRLLAIEQDYADRGVAFLFANFSEYESGDEIAKAVAALGFESRYAIDPEARIGRALQATSTTEVFALDAARTLRYRGAVDDQYGIGFAHPKPRQHFLREAIDAVLAGEDVALPATTSPGCFLELDFEETDDAAEDVTYHNRISRIVQANCLSCHREGSVGPFALDTHRRVAGRKGMLRYVLDEKIMPPWHADETGGPWRNDRALPDEDREAFAAWIDAGCPEGDPADAPLPCAFTAGWQMGEPDAVLRLPEAFAIPAEGAIDYRYAYVKTDFGEDKWITAMEFRPTAPQVVHHALIFVEEPRRPSESREDFRRRWQGGLRGYFGGMVPGQGPSVYPDGVAKKLPAGAWLKFQMHYTPNGVATTDRTEVGFLFTDAPPRRVMRHGSAMTTKFEIPAGAADHVVTADHIFRRAVTLNSFAPHMHLRGTSFRYDLVFPDGRRETILNIPRYDFNWQTAYRLLTPLSLPAGTRLHATATFDNSAANPANPDPTIAVEFGEQTWDEMMIGYFEWWDGSGPP